MAELMIAIAILGLGLLVVAAMFPIAWGKARDLAEHSTALNCAAAAEVTVTLVTRVDSAAEGANFTSFAGDYMVETDPADTKPNPIVPHDTLVHALTLQNLLVGGGPVPGPGVQDGDPPWALTGAVTGSDVNFYRVQPDYQGVVQQWYDDPQVSLHERIYPPVDPYPEGVSDPDEIDEWNARFDTRRFGWAVFHRLNAQIAYPQRPDPWVPGSPEVARFVAERRRAAQTPRTFTMYYVTLGFARGARFPRQDSSALAAGEVKALDHDPLSSPSDVRLPSPWLVPIRTPDPGATGQYLNYRDPTIDTDPVPRGLPTEVLVEAVEGTDDDYRDFFQPGARFIDGVNGEVYRVVKVRYDDDGFDDGRFNEDSSAQLEALVTLDREIFMEDLGLTAPGMYDPDLPWDRRWVWIFPPPIERTARNQWASDGTPPVVAIDVRSMVKHPL